MKFSERVQDFIHWLKHLAKTEEEQKEFFKQRESEIFFDYDMGLMSEERMKELMKELKEMKKKYEN